MNPPDHDHRDDEAFDAFLQGRGELAQLLQQLPQPTPPEALSAAIVAQAQAALRLESSANDARVNGPHGAPLPPHFLRRARLPLALAASVVLAVIVGVQWQGRLSEPATVLVAQAPPSQIHAPPPAAAPTATLSKAPDASKSAAALGAAKKQVPSAEQAPMPPTVLAQADIAQANSDAAVFRSVPSATRAEAQPAAVAAPTPAAVAAAPAASVAASPAPAAPTVDVEKAKAWLKLIDELIKADMRRDALEEWERFRKDYPHYPVPEKLSAKIKALKP